MIQIECEDCEAQGGIYYTCCGDEMEFDGDSDICPTCGEHCGEGDFDPCPTCNGNGYILVGSEKEVEAHNDMNATMITNHHHNLVYCHQDNIWVGPNKPPRSENRDTYYNSVTGIIWKLINGSWRWDPSRNQTDLTKLPVAEIGGTDFDIDLKNYDTRLPFDGAQTQNELKELLKKLPNEQTTDNTDEPLQDYSIFKS